MKESEAGRKETERQTGKRVRDYYLYLASFEEKVFADDTDKYHFLQMQYMTFLRHKASARAFVLTDDLVCMLLCRDEENKPAEREAERDEENRQEQEAERGEEENRQEKKKPEAGFWAKNAACEVLYGKYIPYYCIKYKENAGRIRPELQIAGPLDRAGMLRAAVRIHLMPMLMGLTTAPDGWYWSSLAAYRGECRWDFLNTEDIRSVFEHDGQKALPALLRCHKREWKDLKDCVISPDSWLDYLIADRHSLSNSK